MNTNAKKLGIIVRNYRKSKHYSTQELAKLINVSTGFVNNVENAKNDPFKLELFCNLIETLNIPINEIFDDQYFVSENSSINSTKIDIEIYVNDKIARQNLSHLRECLLALIKSYIDLIQEFETTDEVQEILSGIILMYIDSLKTLKRI